MRLRIVYHHSEDGEYLTLFNDIMELHPKLREFVTAIASADDPEGYQNFCQMVRICAIDSHICTDSVPI